jgi:hypothetical protein
MNHRLTHPIPLTQIQRIRKWHVAHKVAQPLEYHLWDAVMTVWMMGWVGGLPAFLIDAWWALPLCGIAIVTPNLYVGWREQAHAMQRLRCDWLHCID